MRAEWDASDGREQRFLRPESRDIRRRRHTLDTRRLGRLGLRLGLGLALAAAAALAARALLSSPHLAIRKVTFEGDHRTSAAFLASIEESLRGRNVLAVDLGALEERLVGEGGWVRSATVHRALPDRIDVVLAEHEPVARLSDGRSLLTGAGTLVAAEPAFPGDEALTLVACAPAGAPEADTLAHVVELVGYLRSGPSSLMRRVAAIDANDPEDLVLHLADAPWTLHLGTGGAGSPSGEMVSRLNRFLNVEPVLRTRYPGIETVDLRFRDRVVVSPVDPSPKPGSPVGG